MSSEAREVLLEVYINGVLYSADSYSAFDDKDVQLELEITDAVYEPVGCSSSQEVEVRLQVLTNDQVSVRYYSPGEIRLEVQEDNVSVCEVNDLQLEMNRNEGISELTNPPLVIHHEDLNQLEENHPRESTAMQMFKKIKTFFKQMHPFDLRRNERSVGQPEVDLLDPEESCVPDPRAQEPEPKMDLVDTEQWFISERDLVVPPEMDLFLPPELDLVAVPELKLDVDDSKELQVIPKESTKATKIKEVASFVLTKEAEYVAVRNIQKISISAQPEMNLSVPKQEPEEDLVVYTKPKRGQIDSVELYPLGLCAQDLESEEYLVLPSEPKQGPVDSVALYPPALCVQESDSEEDLVDPPEPKLGLVDSVTLYPRGLCVQESDSEEDLVDPPEPKLGLVDSVTLYPRGLCVQESDSEEDLVDPPEPKLGLVDSVTLYPRGLCVQESDSEEDLVDPPEPKRSSVDLVELYPPGLCAQESESEEYFLVPSEPKQGLVDAVKLYSPGSIVPDPEHEYEWDLVDYVELYPAGPSVPKPDPDKYPDDPPERKLNVVDSLELCAWGSSFPEPQPEVNLFDSIELCAPGESVPNPYLERYVADLKQSEVESELLSLENYVPLNVFQLEQRLKNCKQQQSHVTNIWTRLFIGDEEIATDRDALREMCITHILNAAAPKKDLKYLLGRCSKDDVAGSVNTGSIYYRGLHINYYGLPTADRRCSDISKYFRPAAKFIDKALRKRANKVLICCKQGVEHSATLLLAYLMIYHDIMLEEAIDYVIKWRRIEPSRDFLEKLMLLNADLVQKRKLKLQDMKAGKKKKRWQLKKK
ncbi:uncharacterized protein LOC122334486 [Puntigrus tetrazona]|uniref:uncharacterized protein LOC122334486 n=1 Tax=Puntigrus tetrazona TaxID=1606681 RepID=UPI001C89CB97|nr:uncharacterized protein LOC122334486 [Puntigrus tetrazona]